LHLFGLSKFILAFENFGLQYFLKILEVGIVKQSRSPTIINQVKVKIKVLEKKSGTACVKPNRTAWIARKIEKLVLSKIFSSLDFWFLCVKTKGQILKMISAI